MNKKFLSAILFGALMVSSTGTFVSCKDYDDDIEGLQEQITANKNALAELQEKIKGGEWVSGVTSTDNGIIVTLGNGNKFEITNGTNGTNGKDGVTPKIAVNNGKIQVSHDNGATWTDLVSLEDLKGEAGQAAQKPIFSLGENGHIFVQYGEAGEKVDLGVSTGGIFYVEEGAKLTLHVPDKNGEFKNIVLPRAAAISSIAAVKVADDKLSAPETVKLAYGVADVKGKYFDGTAFKKGDILLPSTEAGAVINAQVNPTIADATKYDFYLTNSKGETVFELGQATPNMTEKALSRKATANKGIYDMAITFAAGVNKNNIEALNGQALAIATKDAYDNEVLSAYDVTVAVAKATNTTFGIAVPVKNVEVNTAFDLSKCVTMKNVIDVQYFFAEGQTAAVDAAQASIDGSKITGKVAGKSVNVSVKFLTVTGEVVECSQSIKVTFIAPATENAYTQELVLNADAAKNILTFDVTSIVGNTTETAPNFFTIGAAKFTAAAKDKNDNKEYKKGDVAVGIVTPTAVVSKAAAEPANGYFKHTVTYTVENSKVIPGTYEAVLTYGQNPTNSVKLTLVIKDQTSSFDFKPLDLYFTGTNAVAYGNPSGDKVSYNLKGLFGKADNEWTNVKFSEIVPKAYKDAEGIQWTANKWLTANFGEIQVDKVATKDEAAKTGVFGGAYEARTMKATYTPFANKNLGATVFEFSLTIKSSVFEGSLDYVKKVVTKNDKGEVISTKYEAADAKVIEVVKEGAKAELTSAEIRGITKTGVEYFGNANLDKAYVVSATAALADENAKLYLEMTGNFANGYTIKPNAKVTIPGDGKSVTCTVRVSVVDMWGKTKTVDVPVVLK